MLQVNLEFDATALADFGRLVDAPDAATRRLAIDQMLTGADYQSLIRNEFPATVLADLLAAGFGDSEANFGAMGAAYARHIGEAAGQYAALLAFTAKLSVGSSGHGVEIARLLRPVTPASAFERYDFPVGLLVFGYDARAYDRLLVDALFAMKNAPVLVHILAHEVHHKIRRRHVEYDLDACPDSDLGAVLWTADQIQAEGIADLLDKDEMFALPVNREWGEKYNGLIVSAADIVAKLNALVAQDNFAELKNALPMAGHAVGRYVAGEVDADFASDPALVMQPSALLAAYNQAAQSDARFSAGYMQALVQAEAECR